MHVQILNVGESSCFIIQNKLSHVCLKAEAKSHTILFIYPWMLEVKNIVVPFATNQSFK